MSSLGIVSDEDFLKEIERMEKGSIIDELSEPIIKDIKNPGRRVGDIETPDIIRKLVGDTALTNGNKEAQTLARELKINEGVVPAYKIGATSMGTYQRRDTPLAHFLQNRRKHIAAKASKLAVNALDSITNEKLLIASATELATIAKSASAIVKDMLPEEKSNDNGENNPSVQFIIHAPQLAREERFDVIDVRSIEEIER